MPTWLPWALLVVGGLGIAATAVAFVTVTLPHHLGSNPGFGAFESSAAPWWALACVGIGIVRSSLGVGAGTFLVGLVVLGLFAQVLSRLFGRPSTR